MWTYIVIAVVVSTAVTLLGVAACRSAGDSDEWQGDDDYGW